MPTGRKREEEDTRNTLPEFLQTHDSHAGQPASEAHALRAVPCCLWGVHAIPFARGLLNIRREQLEYRLHSRSHAGEGPFT